MSILNRFVCGASALSVLILATQLSLAAEAKPTNIKDVRLAAGGVLQGRLVDRQGIALASAQVVVRSGQTGIAHKAVSDENGRFTVKGLHGGVYSVSAGRTASVVRLWPAKGAPPSSKPNVELVQYEEVIPSQRVIRGQAIGHPGYIDYLPIAGIITSAAVIPVVVSDQPSS